MFFYILSKGFICAGFTGLNHCKSQIQIQQTCSKTLKTSNCEIIANEMKTASPQFTSLLWDFFKVVYSWRRVFKQYHSSVNEQQLIPNIYPDLILERSEKTILEDLYTWSQHDVLLKFILICIPKASLPRNLCLQLIFTAGKKLLYFIS